MGVENDRQTVDEAVAREARLLGTGTRSFRISRRRRRTSISISVSIEVDRRRRRRRTFRS